jgi:putative copper export protein
MPDYLITWIHLIAAVTLMGGLVFSQFVLNPAAQQNQADQKFKEVVRLAGRRFRTIAWVCLITLILTGSYQMLNESGSARIETTWGVVLMLKIFLFVIVFGLILIHDFIIDPHAPSLKKTPNPSPSAPSSRADNLQKVIILMTLAVLLVASYLTTI